MGVSQKRPKRTNTGGRYHSYKKKRIHELGGRPTLTKLDESKRVTRIGVGGNVKRKFLSTNIINLMGKDGKCVQAKITTTKENPANKHFVRRNILTKGTIIDTDKGKAKITSRPGQVGTLNGVLVE